MKTSSRLTARFYEELQKSIPGTDTAVNDLVNPVDIIDTRILASKDSKEDLSDKVSVCVTGFFIRPADGTGETAVTFAVEKGNFKSGAIL